MPDDDKPAAERPMTFRQGGSYVVGEDGVPVKVAGTAPRPRRRSAPAESDLAPIMRAAAKERVAIRRDRRRLAAAESTAGEAAATDPAATDKE